MACFFRGKCDKTSQFIDLSIQVAVCRGEKSTISHVVKYGLEKKIDYIRLDYNLGSGISLNKEEGYPLFKEKVPHVHHHKNRQPWIDFNHVSYDNVFLKLMDYVYRNYFYNEWINDIQQVWVKSGRWKDEMNRKILFNSFKTDCETGTFVSIR